MRNRSLQVLKHQEVRNRYKEVLLSKEENSTSSPQELLEYKELQDLINRTLYRLPERRMQIFRMHRFGGMKYTEIATALSISIKTVEAEMTKALHALRKEIESYTT